MKRYYVLLLTLALSVLLFAAAEGAPRRLEIGAPAPALSGSDLTGQAHDLSEYRGRWVFVDFWATWCNPCMRALPQVVELQQQMRDRSDFSVLGVSLDDSSKLDAVKGTASSYGVSYPVIYDGQGWNSAAARGWSVNAIPATFLIDPDGNVVARDVEPSQVKQLLAKYAPKSAPKLAPPAVPQPVDATMPTQKTQPAPATPKVRPITSQAQLLDGSPSVGRSDRRDLVLTFNSKDAAQGGGLYLLHVQASTYDPQGQPLRADARFEIIVNYFDKEPTAPYTLEIRPAAGSKISQGIVLLNDISAELDAARHVCRLTVPVPLRSAAVSYELTPFDRQQGQYLRSVPIPVGM